MRVLIIAGSMLIIAGNHVHTGRLESSLTMLHYSYSSSCCQQLLCPHFTQNRGVNNTISLCCVA